MRKAIIKNGVVENVIVWGPNWKQPDDVELAEGEKADIGWVRENGKLRERPRSKPEFPENPNKEE